MTRKLSIVLLLFVGVACKEISFREPQPKARKPLSSIPVSLQGKYLSMQEDGELTEDTLIITSQGYRFGYKTPPLEAAPNFQFEEGVLSDSLVMKQFKGYYFVSFYQKPEWHLRVLLQSKNGDLVYMTPEQPGIDFKDYVKKLSNEIKIDSFMAADKMVYHIDPSPNQLISLVEKGYFNRTVLRKVK